MPAELRPDLSHVVLSVGRVDGREAVAAHVDAAHPQSWREGRMGEVLLNMSTRLPVAVRIGSRQLVLIDRVIRMDHTGEVRWDARDT